MEYLPLTKIAKKLDFTGMKYNQIKEKLIKKGYLAQYGNELRVTYKNRTGTNDIFDNGRIKKTTPKFRVSEVFDIINDNDYKYDNEL